MGKYLTNKLPGMSECCMTSLCKYVMPLSGTQFGFQGIGIRKMERVSFPPVSSLEDFQGLWLHLFWKTLEIFSAAGRSRMTAGITEHLGKQHSIQ